MVNLAIYKSGLKAWYIFKILSRRNGPAIKFACGDKSWYQSGNLHRLDGPARECSNGEKEWYYQGKYIDCSNQEEFERLIKLRLLW